MRLISEYDVDRLVDPSVAVDIAAEAFVRQATGEQPAPGRLDTRRADPRAGMLVLAGFSTGRLGIVKSNMHAYSGTPAKRRTASLLAVWDMHACVPLALIASTRFNGHRTASGFAAAARILARPDARTLTIFGAGNMTWPSIAYMARVRPIDRVVIKSRRVEQAAALAEKMRTSGEFPDIAFEPSDDAAAAASVADIIVCVTSADQPVFPGEAVRPGTFVVLGGANRPSAREVDDALLKRSLIYVDHLQGCLEKAGDLRVSLAAGTLRQQDLGGEIGALIAGRTEPRPAEVIAFKSIGIAPQDLALAEHILERAEHTGVGVHYDPETGAVGGGAT